MSGSSRIRAPFFMIHRRGPHRTEFFAMKLVTEYLADAANFGQLATMETDPAKKEQLLQQAAAYHRLAEKRAKTLGLPFPPKPTEAA
jgi:hypothetical protein